MDCARNEKLLALHAGGDLPEAQARALSAHLLTCEGCRRLAADFKAGRELLALHEPPEFDAAFFDSVRRNVLREIGGDAPPPPAFARLAAILFGRRALALAACAAFLLVAAVAIAPYLRGRREPAGDAPPRLAASNSGDARQEPAPSPVVEAPGVRAAETGTKHSAGVVASPPQRRQFAASAPRPPRVKRETRRDAAAAAASDVAAANDDAHAFDAASIPQDDAAISEVAELAAPAERKMLRIELQTGDPNVRIIWLSPQEPQKLPR